MFHFPLKTATTALAALLLAGSLAAQQAPDATAPTVKAKVKTKRAKREANSAAPAAGPTLPTPVLAPSMPAPGTGTPGLAPPPAPGHGPQAGLGRGPQPGPHPAQVQQLTDFTGTLTGYRAGNDDQVYDRFAFNTSTGTDTVRFPRHLGQALMAAAKPGSTITFSGFRDTDPAGRPALHLVSLTAGGQTLRDTPPTPSTTPPTEESVTVRGTVQRLAQDPAGRPTTAVLTDGTVLRLPPAAAEQLAAKLKAGAAVAATGTLRAAHPGEAVARPVRVVRPQTLTLDGTQYLVR